MSLSEIKAEVAAAEADRIDELIQESGRPEWSMLEDAVARKAWVVGIFQDKEAMRSGWRLFEADLAGAGLGISGPPVERELADRDWKDSYKAHFKAWKFGSLNWVPAWERETFVLPAGEEVLWLDPGMAFGTGNHETTRLCCERLVEFAAQRGTAGRVLDAGCGSGILALSAAKLGFRRIAAFDNDPLAVEIAGENARLNGLAEAVEFRVADLVAGLSGSRAGLVLANIQADVLIRFARELGGAVAPAGRLVLSGVLAGELAQVRAAFAEVVPGWSLESRTLGEWSDLVIDRSE